MKAEREMVDTAVNGTTDINQQHPAVDEGKRWEWMMCSHAVMKWCSGAVVQWCSGAVCSMQYAVRILHMCVQYILRVPDTSTRSSRLPVVYHKHSYSIFVSGIFRYSSTVEAGTVLEYLY